MYVEALCSRKEQVKEMICPVMFESVVSGLDVALRLKTTIGSGDNYEICVC